MAFCLFLPFSVSAEGDLSCYGKLGLDEGLSQNTVKCILRDSRGLLWIGTRCGLNLYDQTHIETFYHKNDDPSTIPSNNLSTLQEDSRGNILVGTYSGLSIMDRDCHTCTSLTDDVIWCSLHIGSHLLFGSTECIYLYDMDDGSFSRATLPSSFVRERTSVRYMVSETDDNIILATSDNLLLRFNVITGEYGSGKWEPVPDIYGLHRTDDGTLFISSYKDGIYRLSPDGSISGHWNSVNSKLTHDIVNGFMKDGDLLYCSTDGGGINVMDPVEGRFVRPYKKGAGTWQIPTNSLTLIQKDYSGNIWVGTVRNGLLNLKPSFIHTFMEVPAEYRTISSGLSEKSVASLFEEQDGTLWIGTDGNGLNMYSPKDGSFRHFEETLGMSIISITDMDDENLLLSAFNRGFFLFSKERGTLSRFIISDEESDRSARMSWNLITAHRVTDDEIYILGEGLTIYDSRNRSFRKIESAPQGDLTLAHTDGRWAYIIMGSGKNIIWKMNLNTHEVQTLCILGKSEIIKSVTSTPDGRLFIGSNQGLTILDPVSQKPERFKTSLFSRITSLKADRQGRVWIAADNSLFTYDKEIITEWGSSDGYRPNEITDIFSKIHQSPYLYFGGTEGLIRIDLQNIRFTKEDPHIHVRSFTIDGTAYPLNDTPVRIPSDYKSITLSVCTDDSDLFRRKAFRYTIKDSHSEYMTLTGSSELNIPALKDGTYTISAVCMMKNGIPSKEQILADIKVLKPWYRSTPAVVLYMLAFICSAVAFHVRRNRHLENLRKEQMVRDEQDRQRKKLQNLLIMCHELKTPLSLIYTPLKSLMKKNPTEKISQESLTDIFQQTCHLRDVVNMILDLNKLNKGNLELNLSVHPFNKWMNEIIHPFIREFSENGVELRFIPDQNIHSLEYDDKKLRIVISNLLSNALKFSPSGTCVKVTVSHDTSSLTVSVIDEGLGLTEADTEKLFNMFYQADTSAKGNGIGLAYSYELIRLHGGTLTALSNPGDGATFSFSIPLIEKTSEKNIGAGNDASRISDSDMESLASYCTGYTLLIIDDNQDFNHYLKNELMYCFRNIYTSFDGEKGMSVALDKKPDIILCDVMMPGMNGHELCRKIRGTPSVCNSTIILMTSDDDPESLSVGYRDGADNFIAKPFDLDLLISMIGNSLKKKERISSQYRKNAGLISRKENGITLSDEQFLLELDRMILENISNSQLNIPFLMKKMNLGRTVFFGRVKSVTGMTVTEYINQTRITKAIHLIENSQLTMSEIADKVGFNSLSRFSTLFKHHTSKTPKEYKKHCCSSL